MVITLTISDPQSHRGDDATENADVSDESRDSAGKWTAGLSAEALPFAKNAMSNAGTGRKQGDELSEQKQYRLATRIVLRADEADRMGLPHVAKELLAAVPRATPLARAFHAEGETVGHDVLRHDHPTLGPMPKDAGKPVTVTRAGLEFHHASKGPQFREVIARAKVGDGPVGNAGPEDEPRDEVGKWTATGDMIRDRLTSPEGRDLPYQRSRLMKLPEEFHLADRPREKGLPPGDPRSCYVTALRKAKEDGHELWAGVVVDKKDLTDRSDVPWGVLHSWTVTGGKIHYETLGSKESSKYHYFGRRLVSADFKSPQDLQDYLTRETTPTRNTVHAVNDTRYTSGGLA